SCARALQWSDHLQACLAECDGRDLDVSALRPQQLDHDADGARFFGLWLAAGITFARRTFVAGKVEFGGALARPHRLSGDRDHAVAAGLHWRGRARRVRSEEDACLEHDPKKLQTLDKIMR